MTIGIYSLYWEECDQVYIGQSIEIEKRWYNHNKHFEHGTHSNPRMQSLFNKLGPPSYLILEICSSIELNLYEKQWSEIFDSVKNGLNILDPGKDEYIGTNNANSKHSKITILKIFSLLYRTDLPQYTISKKLKVPRSLVGHICAGITHIWLKESYPKKYSLLKLRSERNLAKNKCKKGTLLR